MMEFHGPHQVAGDVSTHYPGFYTNYGHHYGSTMHTHTHTHILQVSMVSMSMRVPCLPGSPSNSRLLNAESVTTRNFTDNEIYMKTEEIKEDESRLRGKILKCQPKKYDL
jgi:hypothetical protein